MDQHLLLKAIGVITCFLSKQAKLEVNSIAIIPFISSFLANYLDFLSWNLFQASNSFPCHIKS